MGAYNAKFFLEKLLGIEYNNNPEKFGFKGDIELECSGISAYIEKILFLKCNLILAVHKRIH